MNRNTLKFEIPRHAGSIREVIGLSVPLMIAHTSQSLMWVVDTFLMGRLGSAEQGAVGFAGNIGWAFTCFFAGTLTVISVLVAQDFGAGRHDLARHVTTGLFLCLPMSLLLLLAIPWVPEGLDLMGVTEQAREHAEVYLTIRLYSTPVVLSIFVLSSFLRGIGDMVTPMVVVLISNVANVVFSVLLVFGLAGLPKMGVAGAAWGTVIASIIELALYATAFARRRARQSRIPRYRMMPTLGQIRHFLQLGLPIGGAWILEMVSWSALTIYAGTRPVHEFAAHAILYHITEFCFMPTVAIGIGASTLVAQYIGAQRFDLARKSARSAMAFGIGYMSTIGGAMALWRYPMVQLFNQDMAVIPVGCTIALIAALYQPFEGFSLVAQGVLRGAHNTIMPVKIMFFAGLFVFLPLLWYLAIVREGGIYGAWIAVVIYMVAIAILTAVALSKSLLYRGKRETGKVRVQGPVRARISQFFRRL